MGVHRRNSVLTACMLLMLCGCQADASNPNDPASADFMTNSVLRCLLTSCADGSQAAGVGANPLITAAIPAAGGTAVGIGTAIRLTFDQAMTPATITANATDTNCATGSWKVSSDDFATCVRMAAQPSTTDSLTFQVKPNVPLAGGAMYKIRVTTAARSATGAALAQEYEFASGFTTNNGRTVFVTATTVLGNMGAFGVGPAGADAVCNVDVNRPWQYSSYKAILADDALTRRAVPATDWPIVPSTTYYKPDGTTVLDTSDGNGIFAPPLTNALVGGAANVWTGMNNMWAINAGLSCQSWTSGLNAENGRVGAANATGATFVNSLSQTCDVPAALYCAEQ